MNSHAPVFERGDHPNITFTSVTSPTLQTSASEDTVGIGVLRHVPGLMGGIVLAIGALTANVYANDPWRESRQSGACSAIVTGRRKLGNRISAHRARFLAMQILSVADQELRQERVEESRRLLAGWDDILD